MNQAQGTAQPFVFEDESEEEVCVGIKPVREVLRDIIPVGDAGGDGRGRMYARNSDGREMTFCKKRTTARPRKLTTTTAGNYCGMNIHRLMDRVALEDIELEQLKKVAVEAKSASSGGGGGEQHHQTKNAIWSETYRARSYQDLVGDERTHRDVFRWLKQWDKCVHKKKEKRKESAVVAKTEIEDVLGRPLKKILMLTGPPGFGKTTLAAVAARQCGYEPMEINASDDRSGKVVRDKVSEVLSSHSLGSTKHRCLILDEVDGVWGGGGGGDAEGSFVKALVDLVTREERTRSSKKRRKGGSSTKSKPLLRPIICICNDQYAPVLRPLRPHVHIISVRKPPTIAIVHRLHSICKRESLDAEHRALTTLADRMEGDMRSCINTLQLLNTRAAKIDMATVSEHAVTGQKDFHSSSYAAVEAMFSQKIRKGSNMSAEDELRHVMDQAAGNGEYEKIVQSAFDYFLTQPFHDSLLQKANMGYEWLYYFDRLHTLPQLAHNYQSAVVGAFWHLFSTPKRHSGLPRLEQTSFHVHEKHSRNQEIFKEWIDRIRPVNRQGYSPTLFQIEISSYVLKIASPDLKPVIASFENT